MNTHQPKKRFGQNFLADEFIVQQIVYAINPRSDDHLVEIGPGVGAITLPLLPLVAQIDAIELDREIIPILKRKTTHFPNLIIHQQDALHFNLSALTHEIKSLRIVGNLPYNISTPLLFHLFNQQQFIIDMHFMLQKEVGERLCATPGHKNYGRLSVMAQYHCEIESLIFVPPHSFRPAPKVDSLFIRLIPFERDLVAKDLMIFDGVVKSAFSQRRKTISNSLKKLISKEHLEFLGIDANKRAEELSIENFVIISNFLAAE